MALIKEIIREERNIRKQSPAQTTYSVSDGYEKLFQITMYGSGTRENPHVASQTIQFDKIIAKEIVEILTKEFDL